VRCARAGRARVPDVSAEDWGCGGEVGAEDR